MKLAIFSILMAAYLSFSTGCNAVEWTPEGVSQWKKGVILQQIMILNALPKGDPDIVGNPDGLNLSTWGDINATQFARESILSIGTSFGGHSIAILTRGKHYSAGSSYKPTDHPQYESIIADIEKCPAIDQAAIKFQSMLTNFEVRGLNQPSRNSERQLDGGNMLLSARGFIRSKHDEITFLQISVAVSSQFGLWAYDTDNYIASCGEIIEGR